MTPAPHFTQFGKYEIIRKLGRSMTDVYLALDTEWNRRVVLKIVEQCRDAYTQQVVEAERRGAAIQQQLHAKDPSILEVYEFGDRNGCFFLAMQYVEGRTLAELVHRDGRIGPMSAARFAAEICRQLRTLHGFEADFDGQRRAIVHGDIKPSNVQIGASGEVWLLDFGIAKAISATRNLTQHSFGSPAYCSPERIRNGQVDPHADLWAVGVCLYEMLSGIPPYQAQTTRKLEDLIQSRRPPRALPADCPAALKAIVQKALAAGAERRYRTAADFESDLRTFLDGRRTAAETEHAPSWDANATLERARPAEPAAAAPVHPEVKRKFARFIADFNRVIWSVIAGVAVGLLCLVPGAQLLHYWNQSAPLRAERDYRRASLADIESDWRVYGGLNRRFASLASWSPVGSLKQSFAARLEAGGDSVLHEYRNSGEPDLGQFDWERAELCFQRAVSLRPESPDLKGKLALAAGYRVLRSDPPAAAKSFREAAKLLPDAPDVQLALARVEVYQGRNTGSAIARFHAAERLGYRLGPREFEQQGDGYLFRAEQTMEKWRQARQAGLQRRYEAAMLRDFERARGLYEPIAGFSKVDASLDRLERDLAAVERLRTERQAAAQRRKYAARYRQWR
jgi:eukaryotic-like serine/threonine-protein kinase